MGGPAPCDAADARSPADSAEAEKSPSPLGRFLRPELAENNIVAAVANTPESLADLRRKKLTQVDVLSAAPPLLSLSLPQICCAGAAALLYVTVLLPQISTFGDKSWREAVATSQIEARPGGLFAEVSLGYLVMLSLSYVSLSFIGVNRMAQRPTPVRCFIFECMAVHNIMQCLFNLYCFVMLLAQAWILGLRLWGNTVDASERGHTLGWLLWLQYHCRQLQLAETAFMVLRKKFRGTSFLHAYLRVLNLVGWYIACRLVGGGEAVFPALVSSACQAVVYGLYFSFSLVPGPGAADATTTEDAANGSGRNGHSAADTKAKSAGTEAKAEESVRSPKPTRAARVFELQIAQYVICAVHSIVAAIWGTFPVSLAMLHLFVIANGLILYTDFHSQKSVLPRLDLGPTAAGANSATANRRGPTGCRRVTFSFDSCGWLMVYHFGVASWLMENMGLDAKEAVEGVAFSGSSGGSLVSCVLAAGTDCKEVFEYVLGWLPACRKNPLKMFTAVRRALEKFQYPEAPKRLTTHLRVLLTRVQARPPFVMGEVADYFPDNDIAVEILCASCHVPFVAGVLPVRIGEGYYYDGLVWPSRLLVPWRGEEGDHVVRVSACGAPLADIGVQQVPFWWAILPPSPEVLRGVFWCGYRDAARWFATQPKRNSLSSCGCRRDAQGEDMQQDASTDVDSSDTALARWRAANALCKKAAAGERDRPLLPEKDPKTGQDIQALVERTEAHMTSALRMANFAMFVLIASGAAMAAAALGFVLVPGPAGNAF